MTELVTNSAGEAWPATDADRLPVLEAVRAHGAGGWWNDLWAGALRELANRLASTPYDCHTLPAAFDFAPPEPGAVIPWWPVWADLTYAPLATKAAVFSVPRGRHMLEVRFVTLDYVQRPVVWPAVLVLDHGRGEKPGYADRVRQVNGLRMATAVAEYDLPVMNALTRWTDAADHLVAIRALPDGTAATLAQSALPRTDDPSALRRTLSNCATEIRGRSLSDAIGLEAREVARELFDFAVLDGPRLAVSALAACSTETLVAAAQSRH